jgi:hypothetical protein
MSYWLEEVRDYSLDDDLDPKSANGCDAFTVEVFFLYSGLF